MKKTTKTNEHLKLSDLMKKKYRMNTEKNSTSAHSALNYPPTMEEIERKFDVEKMNATK